MFGLGYLFVLLLLLLVALAGWRVFDHLQELNAWKRLIRMEADNTQTFDPAMVSDLPEPARRYFKYTITPGTILRHVVEVEMTGELGLGTKDAPNYRPMQARQILAPPYGFIWSLHSGAIQGSDGALPDRSWTRFWLLNLIPVARAGGRDHQRSSFGRLIADSVFWAPASMLPGDRVSWEAVSEHCARVKVRSDSLEQTVDVHVDADGAPVKVIFQRWSDANPRKRYQLQPFGGELSAFRDFSGYRLPTRVLGGNHYGTPDYFPFFKATVTGIRYLTDTVK
jgi:hypothetical protein